MNLKSLQKIYFSDHRMELREIRWFRLKMVGIIFGAMLLCLTTILTVNHLFSDFLGLRYNRLETLTQENQLLHNQLVSLTTHMKRLEDMLSKLDREGNRLRLLVDLPPVDEETKKAGTGGAVSISVPALGGSDATDALKRANEVLQQLSSEIALQEQSYSQIVEKYEFNKGYFAAMPALKPMEGYYSNREFGLRMHPVLGVFKTHSGLDIVGDVGTPIVASGDGVVEMAGQSGGGYGTVIMINHGYGYQTLYAHLSSVLVRDGQRVKRGQLIAKSGKTGLVSGPHLHYEVRYKGVCKNPVDFFFDDLRTQDYQNQIVSR